MTHRPKVTTERRVHPAHGAHFVAVLTCTTCGPGFCDTSPGHKTEAKALARGNALAAEHRRPSHPVGRYLTALVRP